MKDQRLTIEVELLGAFPGGTARLADIGLVPLHRGAVVRVPVGLANKLVANGLFVAVEGSKQVRPAGYSYEVIRDRGIDPTGTAEVHDTKAGEATNRSMAGRTALKDS